MNIMDIMNMNDEYQGPIHELDTNFSSGLGGVRVPVLY